MIFPIPCEFISSNLPLCSVIRPTGEGQINAAGCLNALIADGLFIGQPQSLTALLGEMANAADEAACNLVFSRSESWIKRRLAGLRIRPYVTGDVGTNRRLHNGF